jgi:chromosomal replication initiation ATPase DnaA
MNTREQAIKLVDEVCNYYGITLDQLQEVKKRNHWKIGKNKHGEQVRLSEIRMALSYFIYQHCPLKLVEIAPLVGYKDHSTMSIYRTKIDHYIKTEDPKFYPYYLKVIDLASDLGISMKLSRVKSHKKITFVDYSGKLVLVD